MDSNDILAPSIMDRLLDDDPRITSPLFSIFDLVNPAGFAVKLREAEDAVSGYVREHLSTDIRDGIDALDGTMPVVGILQEGIVGGLNRLVDGNCIFEVERFHDISLAEETIRLLEEKPKGRALMFLNRSLLEDTYPKYLRTRRVHETPYTLTEFKRSVSRDIEALLNSRREVLEELPKSFKELNGSILCYGLPDFTAMSLMNHKDRKQIRRSIEQAILIFEPRLKSVEVTVLSPSGLDQALHFRIDALLQIDPEPEAVMFDAVLELSTAKYDVNCQ